MRNRETEVARVEALAPPVPAIEAIRRNLAYQFIHALAGTQPLAEGNMTDLARALMEKAKAGDVKAMRLAVDVIGVASPAPAVTVNNDNRTQLFVSDLRCLVVAVLTKEGPATTAALAQRLDIMPERLLPALDHGWFRKDGECWLLSAEGIRALAHERGGSGMAGA